MGRKVRDELFSRGLKWGFGKRQKTVIDWRTRGKNQGEVQKKQKKGLSNNTQKEINEKCDTEEGINRGRRKGRKGHSRKKNVVETKRSAKSKRILAGGNGTSKKYLKKSDKRVEIKSKREKRIIHRCTRGWRAPLRGAEEKLEQNPSHLLKGKKYNLPPRYKKGGNPLGKTEKEN